MILSWVWWKWEILYLEWELNPHLWHSWSMYYHYTTEAPVVAPIPTPTCLCSSLPQVSIDYYTRPPRIVSLLILTVIYIQAMALHIYIHRVGSTTIQRIACTGSLSQQPVSWVWWKWEILCRERESNPHLWHSGSMCYHYTTCIVSLMSPLYPHPPVYAALASEVSADYYNRIRQRLVCSVSG